MADAPCSSESHLLQNDSEIFKWGSGSSRANAKRQLALHLNALKLTLPGGRIVYSTGSYENDDVVEKALKKMKKVVALGVT